MTEDQKNSLHDKALPDWPLIILGSSLGIVCCVLLTFVLFPSRIYIGG